MAPFSTTRSSTSSPGAPAPRTSPFTGSATHGSRVILPLATNEHSHNCHSLERGWSVSSYQSRSMTAGLLDLAPMHRRRHRTRITFPSTTPVAWSQELGLPRWEVPVLPALHPRLLGCSQGRGETHRLTHRPSWAVGEKHRKKGRSPSQAQPGGAPGL